MANPRAFISFDFDHNSIQKMLFEGQIKNSRTPFDVQNWSSKTSLPQAEWELLLASKINVCHLMIVLVGRHISSAMGVRKEIEMAAKANVPVFGVYVDGANGTSNLPDGLSRSRVINWEWPAIASRIDQCMKEGKNK